MARSPRVAEIWPIPPDRLVVAVSDRSTTNRYRTPTHAACSRPSGQGMVTVITVATTASAVHKTLVWCPRSVDKGPARGWKISFLLDAMITPGLSATAGIYVMDSFLKATFNRQKFQGLFVSTAIGNFAAYVAGSLVTVVSTRHEREGRAISNLFGVLPRKTVVVHVLPHWLEWLLALILGFLVMEGVRYWFNHRKYAALLSALRKKPRTDSDRQASEQAGAAEPHISNGGRAQQAPAKSGQFN